MADVTIYDLDGNVVFDSEADGEMGEQFLVDHPDEAFRIVIKGHSSGMTFTGDLTAHEDD